MYYSSISLAAICFSQNSHRICKGVFEGEKRDRERKAILSIGTIISFFVCVSFSCVHFVVILCLNLLVNTIERLPLFYLSFNDFSLYMAVP